MLSDSGLRAPKSCQNPLTSRSPLKFCCFGRTSSERTSTWITTSKEFETSRTLLVFADFQSSNRSSIKQPFFDSLLAPEPIHEFCPKFAASSNLLSSHLLLRPIFFDTSLIQATESQNLIGMALHYDINRLNSLYLVSILVERCSK